MSMEATQTFFSFTNDPETASSLAVLTVREVADILKIRPETVRAEINAGRLAASRLGPKGGVLRVRREWLDEYLDHQKIFDEK